jgi:hypothetical protein
LGSGLGSGPPTGYRERCTAHSTDTENPQNTDRVDRAFEYMHFLIGRFVDSDKHLPQARLPFDPSLSRRYPAGKAGREGPYRQQRALDKCASLEQPRGAQYVPMGGRLIPLQEVHHRKPEGAK